MGSNTGLPPGIADGIWLPGDCRGRTDPKTRANTSPGGKGAEQCTEQSATPGDLVIEQEIYTGHASEGSEGDTAKEGPGMCPSTGTETHSTGTDASSFQPTRNNFQDIAERLSSPPLFLGCSTLPHSSLVEAVSWAHQFPGAPQGVFRSPGRPAATHLASGNSKGSEASDQVRGMPPMLSGDTQTCVPSDLPHCSPVAETDSSPSVGRPGVLNQALLRSFVESQVPYSLLLFPA